MRLEVNHRICVAVAIQSKSRPTALGLRAISPQGRLLRKTRRTLLRVRTMSASIRFDHRRPAGQSSLLWRLPHPLDSGRSDHFPIEARLTRVTSQSVDRNFGEFFVLDANPLSSEDRNRAGKRKRDDRCRGAWEKRPKHLGPAELKGLVVDVPRPTASPGRPIVNFDRDSRPPFFFFGATTIEIWNPRSRDDFARGLEAFDKALDLQLPIGEVRGRFRNFGAKSRTGDRRTHQSADAGQTGEDEKSFASTQEIPL